MLARLKRYICKYMIICELSVSFLLTISLMYMIGKTISREYLLAMLLFIAIFVIMHFGMKNCNGRRLKYSLFYCVPFGIAFWLGQKVIYQSVYIKDFSLLDIPLIISLIIIFTLASMCILGYVDRKCYLPKINRNAVGESRWLLYAVVLLLCWMPMFLAFFPGLISVDSAVQIRQAIGEGGWSNWHPVLHTAFVAIPINIGINVFGDLTAGIALSTVTQMLILCCIFGYTVRWAMELTAKKWVGYLLLVFFALCPTVACYAVTMWKDVLFSAFFMLLIIKLYDLVRKKTCYDKIGFCDLGTILPLLLLVGFLRNGGILIIVGLSMAMLIYFKNARKTIVSGCAIVLVIMMVVQGPLYSVLGIDSSPFMESMSVPAQQLGYVANVKNFDNSEKEKLSKYADIECLKNNYSPMNADPAKNCFDYDAVNKDKFGLVMIWLGILPSHLDDYIKAYILQTYSYWYIQGDAWVLDFGHTHDEKWLEAEYTDNSLLGDFVKNGIIKIEQGLTNAAWFGWMNSVGIMFWGICYMLMLFVYQKRYALMVPMVCVLVYMVSLLVASPVSWIFRYVYSLLLILPILIIICFVKDNKLKGRKEKR